STPRPVGNIRFSLPAIGSERVLAHVHPGSEPHPQDPTIDNLATFSDWLENSVSPGHRGAGSSSLTRLPHIQRASSRPGGFFPPTRSRATLTSKTTPGSESACSRRLR